MAKIKFDTLEFEEKDDILEVTFLKLFYSAVQKDLLESIGEFKIGKDWIDFRGIPKAVAEAKLNIMLAKGFAELKNRLNGKFRHTFGWKRLFRYC
jgi:hypothetical protein